MKLLLTCLLFALPFCSFSQTSVNYSLLDSNENAVLHKNKELEYTAGVRNELISLDRTPNDDLKAVFKKHDGNATTYDYDTYVFDKNNKCKTLSTVISIGKLNNFMESLRNEGFKNNGDNIYYNDKQHIKATVESSLSGKTLTLTFIRK